ncbi:MAG TPA: DNA repair exonuclease [Thermomicrobiales bacterium]|nr:DNA repair exonuclease [Thermomicrobiales bacterium]
MTRPLRIAHLADTHLGYRALGRTDGDGRNQRMVDVERAFEAAIDDLLRREVDLVIHAGDAFHHTRPNWETVAHVIRQFRRIEAAQLACVVVAGNHDTPRLRTTGSVYGLLADVLPQIRFVAGYDMEEVPFDELELVVQAIPHGALTNPDPPMPGFHPGKWNVLATHGLAPRVHVRGQHEPGEERLPAGLLDPDFDYIALGHFHEWGDQGRNAWYSGSAERIGWGDIAVTPGYNLATLTERGAAPHVEHVPVPARPMIRLDPVAGADRAASEIVDEVLQRLDKATDRAAMVRAEVVGAARPARREAETLLRQRADGRVWHLELTSPGDAVFGSQATEGEGQSDVRALFGLFVDGKVERREYDETFAGAFRERGLRALDQGLIDARESGAEGDGA